MANTFDLSVYFDGSIFLVQPLTDAAVDWLQEHVAEDAQWHGTMLVVEHRYVADLVHGAIEDGLRVRRDLGHGGGVMPSSFFASSGIAGTDDALVPHEIAAADPAR